MTEKIAEIPFPDSQLGIALGSSDQLHDESANKRSKLDTLENLQLFKTFRKLLKLKVTKINRFWNKKIRLIFGKNLPRLAQLATQMLAVTASFVPFPLLDGVLKRDALL